MNRPGFRNRKPGRFCILFCKRKEYYGPAEVDRLQDILYYRALGVELARIKRCLDDPSFGDDREVWSRSHFYR